jgi:hypothetical protein
LRDSVEAMKARWEGGEGRVVEYRKRMQDMTVELDAMREAKCAAA